ncbi:MAG: glycosyltransferase family 9 protein [Pseudomonadota bacterium]
MTTLSNSDSFLIITSSSTGNNIFCTPAIRLLRKHLPQAKIDVVALNKLSAEVFAENPDIGQIYVLSKSRDVNKLAKQYSKIIVLNKNALKKLSDIKVPFIQVPLMTDAIHHAEHLLQFVAQLLAVNITDDDRHYVIQTQQTAEALLAKFSVDAKSTLINIHLGCGTTVLHGWKFFYARRADDKKLWSIDAYIALGNALMQTVPNLRIAITGTSNESFLAKKFEKNVPNTINLVGKTTVSDLRALMQRASLFIAHDCGVFHIASASNVPIVGLYGPTNPVATGPFPPKPQHTLIKKAEMADISVQEVVTAASCLLEKFPRLASA